MAQQMQNGREHEIQRIAYEIWENEGRPAGREQEHYFRAEHLWEERHSAAKAQTASKPASSATPVRRTRKSAA